MFSIIFATVYTFLVYSDIQHSRFRIPFIKIISQQKMVTLSVSDEGVSQAEQLTGRRRSGGLYFRLFIFSLHIFFKLGVCWIYRWNSDDMLRRSTTEARTLVSNLLSKASLVSSIDVCLNLKNS